MVVLLAAAMPIRLFQSLPVIGSASILDLLLIAAAATLFMDLAFRPIDVGYPELFLLLSIPLIFATASLVWSEDRNATLRTVLIYAECLIAYLFVVRELSGLAPARIITYIRRYSYLLIIPGVLLLLHVPGFEPRTEAAPSSGDYLTYFTRFSHPILGSSNNLATPLAFFAPILLYWGHTRNDRRATTAAFVSLIAILLTQSRGILLAFAIAGLLYAPLAVRRQPAALRGLGAKIVATVVVGIAAFGIYYALNSSTREFFKDRLTLATVTERSELISLSLRSIASRPLAGYGAGVDPEVDVVTSPGQITSLDLFSDVPVQQTGGGDLDVHNTFLQQAVYFGIPAALLISLALCGIAGVFLARRRSIPLAGVIGYALMVQLVSFVFEASFEGTVLRVLFYLSVGLATALLCSAEKEPQARMHRTG
jgi:O-antigen ligase